jgi:uncharacterized membrane protein YgcG
MARTQAFDQQPEALRRAFYGLSNYVFAADAAEDADHVAPIVLDRFWSSTGRGLLRHARCTLPRWIDALWCRSGSGIRGGARSGAAGRRARGRRRHLSVAQRPAATAGRAVPRCAVGHTHRPHRRPRSGRDRRGEAAARYVDRARAYFSLRKKRKTDVAHSCMRQRPRRAWRRGWRGRTATCWRRWGLPWPSPSTLRWRPTRSPTPQWLRWPHAACGCLRPSSSGFHTHAHTRCTWAWTWSPLAHQRRRQPTARRRGGGGRRRWRSGHCSSSFGHGGGGTRGDAALGAHGRG